MHPVLTRHVASLTAYDVRAAPGVHRGLPGTAMTFVVALDEPIDVAWADTPYERRVGWSCLSGLHERPAWIRHGRRQRGVQVGLTPAGVRALLGVPVGALQGQLLDLEDLGRDLPECLRWLPEEAAGMSVDAAALLVERRCAEALAMRDPVAPRAEVAQALAQLTRGAAVAEVADAVGWSRRHLTTQVRAECGLAPKQFQRVARFERSRDLWRQVHLTSTDTRTLADVGAVCGYADQAHLTREWQVFAGCSPTRWAREEFPGVQDGGRGTA